jgi:hypothetical protein
MQEPRGGGQPSMKEQGPVPGGGSEKGASERAPDAGQGKAQDKGAQQKAQTQGKGDAASDRSAEPKGKADDGKRRAEPKDKSTDGRRAADQKDKAGNTKRSAEPKDKAGDTKRSAEPRDKAGDRSKDQARDRDSNRDQAQTRDGQRSASRIELSDSDRTRVRERLSTHREARVTNVNFSLNVGTRVPRSVRIHTVPADIVTIVPAYRGYRYFIVDERIVIVHPTRYEIVEIIDEGGPRRGRPVTASLTLAPAQVTLITRHIPADRRAADVHIDLALGAEIPDTVELYEFPADVLVEVPAVKPYRYVVLERRIAIVDPTNRGVVQVLDRH